MKKKIINKKTITIAIIVVLAIVLLVTCSKGANTVYSETTASRGDIVNYLEFTGTVTASSQKKIYPEVAATVTSLLVEEGDQVSKGDVIAYLDSSDIEYSIESKELQISESETSNYYTLKDAQTNLNNLQTQLDQGLNSSINSSESALISAQESYYSAVDSYNDAYDNYLQSKADYEGDNTSSIKTALQNVEDAKRNYDRNSDSEDLYLAYTRALSSLADARESARKQMEDYKEAADTAYNNMVYYEEKFAAAQKDYETTVLSVNQSVQSYKDTIEKYSATLSTASSELDLEHTKESLDDYVITSPIDGFVTTLSLKEGEKTSLTSTCAEITDFSEMEISISIDEYDIGSVKEGDEVQIYINALDNYYTGTIASIAKTATKSGDVSYITAKVTFETDGNIMSGLSCEVKLTKDNEENVIILPEDAISYRDDHTAYVLVKDASGNGVETTVSLGVSDGSNVEILSGVNEGDIILYTNSTTNAYQAMMQTRISED